MMASGKYLVIAAGGTGSRMNQKLSKQFIPLQGVPIIVHTIRRFILAVPEIEIIVCCNQNDLVLLQKIISRFLKKTNIYIAKGGATRYHSVKSGLKQIKKDGIVAVHDAVRPFASVPLIQKCFDVAMQNGSCIPVIPLNDSIRLFKTTDSKRLNRSDYCLVQTPQCFKVDLLKKAYKMPFDSTLTDDASLVEKSGAKIFLTEGEIQNFKITTPFDLKVASAMISEK